MSNEIERKEMFGHPVGLYVLFFTELWERFSYYGMRAILTLYMYTEIAGDNPGLGWDKAFALSIYGWYTMAVYVMSIPGGLLADKLLGQKKTVMLGGFLLCAGHGILAVEAEWAFMTGLVLIVLGVGGLKPNISTMVGGLYKQGDIRRDPAFTIFYIGINVGAFLASLIVGYVGETYGWHYGFGLAGIGMLLGQAVFIMGQKHLKGVGESLKEKTSSGVETSKPLTKIEKDRMVVLFLSFLIIIVFWGAFEQAGGLMNIYTNEKVNRFIGGWEVPTSWFQALNPGYIMIFGTLVAGFWVSRQKKGKESSTLLKMAVGTFIMGLGFLMMSGASMEASEAGKASLYWLLGAYLLHTIGELCASPTALSFITKLAPAKYASFMMGAYFAATGFGNKIAGFVGESSQSEPVEVAVNEANQPSVFQMAGDSVAIKREPFKVNTAISFDNELELKKEADNASVTNWFNISEEGRKQIREEIKGIDEKELTATLSLGFEDDGEVKGTLIIDQVQSKRELMTFTLIFVFTAAFGLLLRLFLKKLKALTHGAEDIIEEDTHHEEQEGFEIADRENV